MRASSTFFMKAPLPTFMSSTSASMPSTRFLLMMELAMSGMQSTVPPSGAGGGEPTTAGSSWGWNTLSRPS